MVFLPMISYMSVHFVLCCLTAPYLYWRFSLCFVSSARVNCYTLTTRRVKEVTPGPSTNCSDASAAKAVTALATCIHVYTYSPCSRFPGIKSYGLFATLRLKHSNYPRLIKQRSKIASHLNLFSWHFTSFLQLWCKCRGLGTPRKIEWGCSPLPKPYLWPKSAIFPTLFMNWPKIRNPSYDLNLTCTSKSGFRPAL